MSLRADLDGLRVRGPLTSQVWLIFNGMRHYITSPAAYDALFCDLAIRDVADLDVVLRGPDLIDGTALIRGGNGHIFLVTAVAANEIRRFHIVDWATFQALGFDVDLVRDVPDIVISAIRCAPPILIGDERARLAGSP